MPTTQYDQVDFANITELVANFVNCSSNLGTPPNAVFGGTVAAGYGPENVQVKNADSCSAGLIYTYDLDHTSPLNPVPSNAHITKITIQLQISTNEATAFMDATFATDHGNTGRAIASATMGTDIRPLNVFNTPPPDVGAWITSPAFNPSNPNYLFGFFNETDTTAFGATATASKSGNSPVLAQLEFDFTLNPNGDFPLGYCDYATFVAQFTNFFISYSLAASSSANWISVINGFDNITGSWSNGIDYLGSNLTVFVEWENPTVTTWEVSPTTVTLPDNVITLSRPDDETLDPEQNIEEIWVGEHQILPDDPWVIVWTPTLIVIHLPPDEDDTPPLKVVFAGVQFSGRVTLLTLTINHADLSGIYEFDITAHHDQLYDRTGLPTTQDVEIPAPFLVTYFVGDEEFNIFHIAGTRVRATGQGTIHQVLQSYDVIRTIQFGDEILRTSSNISQFSLTDFVEQKTALRIYMDDLDDFMNISNIIIFGKMLFTGYPR